MKKWQICPPFDLWLILDVKPEVSLFIAFLVFHLFFSLPLEKLNFKSHCFLTVSVYPCLANCSLWIFFKSSSTNIRSFQTWAVEPHSARWDYAWVDLVSIFKEIFNKLMF